MIDLERLYAKHANRVDEVRTGSVMERPYLERVAALAPAPGHVLDLGCGSGEPIARYFVERGYRVTGADFAEEMLQICRRRFPEMNWHHDDIRRIELDQEFDVVLAWDSFFHLTPDDQRSIFRIFRSHMRVGAGLMFTSGPAAGAAIGGSLFGDELYHASLDSDEYAALLAQHDCDVVLHNVEDPECGGHTIWIAQRTR